MDDASKYISLSRDEAIYKKPGNRDWGIVESEERSGRSVDLRVKHRLREMHKKTERIAALRHA
jgi:hypothetical protein